jgi:hypothetical protein
MTDRNYLETINALAPGLRRFLLPLSKTSLPLVSNLSTNLFIHTYFTAQECCETDLWQLEQNWCERSSMKTANTRLQHLQLFDHCGKTTAITPVLMLLS